MSTLATVGVAAQGTTGSPDQFHVGDRIALRVEGPAAFSDTVVVREGNTIQLPNIGEISLNGVRRADAQKYLTQKIGQFIKNPVVYATPLIRVAVVGAVARPGYYSVPSDLILSDVLMQAGGPAGDADINQTVVKRGTTEVLGPAAVTQALGSGKTLDDLRLTSGDQIVVGQKSGSHLSTILQISGALVGLVGVAVALLH